MNKLGEFDLEKYPQILAFPNSSWPCFLSTSLPSVKASCVTRLLLGLTSPPGIGNSTLGYHYVSGGIHGSIFVLISVKIRKKT